MIPGSVTKHVFEGESTFRHWDVSDHVYISWRRSFPWQSCLFENCGKTGLLMVDWLGRCIIFLINSVHIHPTDLERAIFARLRLMTAFALAWPRC